MALTVYYFHESQHNTISLVELTRCPCSLFSFPGHGSKVKVKNYLSKTILPAGMLLFWQTGCHLSQTQPLMASNNVIFRLIPV